MVDGADLFIGVSGPGVIEARDLARMNDDAMVFAMANPEPEVMPEEAAQYARIVATGRSDYPNQINNVLCFPGLFRGALDARATAITEEMKLAAAYGIAEVISPSELSEDYIIPSVFDRRVAEAVAQAVADEARRAGVSRAGATLEHGRTRVDGLVLGPPAQGHVEHGPPVPDPVARQPLERRVAVGVDREAAHGAVEARRLVQLVHHPLTLGASSPARPSASSSSDIAVYP